VRRIETGIDFEEPDETLHHEAGGSQQEQRKRNISENQCAAQTVALFCGRAFAGFFQRFAEIELGSPESGQEAKRETSHQGNSEGESECPGVDLDVLKARQICEANALEQGNSAPR